MRPRDLPFEALAEATSTDWGAGRGELNKALALIKDQSSEDDPLILSMEITERAKLYRRVFPGVALTPTALAKHWLRVFEEAHRQREQQATNVQRPYYECATCGGHGFVVYATRTVEQTFWMKQHGRKASGEIEEWAPCPECSKVDASYRTFDGSMFRPPDPAQVRERLAR